MTIPYRVWTQFDMLTCSAHDPDSHNYTQLSDWENAHQAYGIIGEHKIGANNYEYWVPVYRPKDGLGFEEIAGLDRVADIMRTFILTVIERDTSGAGTTTWSFRVNNAENTNRWDSLLATGRFYDRVNQWDSYGGNGSAPPQVGTVRADFWNAYPISGWDIVEITGWSAAYWGGYAGNLGKDEFYRNGWGAYLFTAGFDILQADGDIAKFGFIPQEVRVRFFNPVVNSLSRRLVSTGGGDTLILTGLGFDMADAELKANGGGDEPFGGFGSIVNKIRFTGQQGQGVTEISTFGGDFTVDSDIQISIASMPALTKGTYTVELSKNMTGLAEFWTAAGPWRVLDSGYAYEGDAFILRVDDDIREDVGGGSLLLTEWKWKDPDGNVITEFLAPIDTRASDVFYHGRILSHTDYSREVNDRTGMFSVGDMTFELANNDKRYSALLATYFLKNQFVGIYHARKNHPEAWKMSLIKMIVDDYEIEGTIFRVMCKDVTNKYFQVTIPRYIINEDEFPNVYESALGQPMPDVLGLHSLTGDKPGAIEAKLIDTVTFKYLAAAGPLHSIPQVYSDGVLQTVAVHYTISYDAVGRTFLDFLADQGDKKITFNCTGYTHAPWNSVNGYVQNPAYVILFMLAFLLEIPATEIDLGSFDDMAATFGTLEVHTAGRWIGQEANTGETVIQELLQTYGAKLFVDRDGKLKLDRKDLANYTTDLFVFDQIHCMKPARRIFGLNEAINVVKAKCDFYPTASLYKSFVEARNETAIVNFEAEREPDSDFLLKWTDSPVLMQLRTVEELVKFSEGYFRGEFSLPIEMLEDLDIMDNFRFQDPFGISADGLGEFGRYFYVVSLRPNFVNSTLDVTAIDLTWLISQESGSGSA